MLPTLLGPFQLLNCPHPRIPPDHRKDLLQLDLPREHRWIKKGSKSEFKGFRDCWVAGVVEGVVSTGVADSAAPGEVVEAEVGIYAEAEVDKISSSLSTLQEKINRCWSAGVEIEVASSSIAILSLSDLTDADGMIL
ncbi:hypothetical protein HK096_006915, partial [Nowakowskiella sp. JEL0078]